MDKFYFLVLFSFWIGSPQLVQAQGPETGEEERPSIFSFFHQQDSIPILKIETDWGLLVRNRQKEEYQPVTLAFKSHDGREVSIQGKLRARGNTRKKVCLYPPVKAKLPKKSLAALGFNSSNDLKLVLPCNGGRSNRDCLLREALAYKLYELIHPVHIRAKVIRLQHWEGDKEAHSFYAFLVEEEDEFAARLGGKIIKSGTIRYAGLDREAYLKMSFFQYMIGNTDWAIPNRHNLETVQVPGYSRIVAVPYDFDYSGMVGTSYAIPHSSLPIKDVSERLFQGKGVTEKEALVMRQFFLDKKEQILGCCTSTELLNNRAGEGARKYIERFFEELENEKRVVKVFCGG